MGGNVRQRLEARISELEGQVVALRERIDRLKELQSTLDDDGLASDLACVFSDGMPGSDESGQDRAPRSSQLDSVKAFFESNGNQWVSAADVEEATGIPQTTIRQMVYSRYPTVFEQRKHPEHSQRKQLRLSEPN